MNNHRQLREDLVRVMRELDARGLNTGSSGNAGARAGDGFLVTPSGIPAEALRPQDLIWMQIGARPPKSGPRPSSEWRCHALILQQRPELGAVLHAHSPYAAALACRRQGIPAFHYMVAVAGGTDIPCAPYATFGTPEFAEAAAAALAERNACLLANHGLLAVGPNLEAALRLLREVELLARQYWLAMQGPGGPVLLSETQMREVLERFDDYGPGR